MKQLINKLLNILTQGGGKKANWYFYHNNEIKELPYNIQS